MSKFIFSVFLLVTGTVRGGLFELTALQRIMKNPYIHARLEVYGYVSD